jgi:hypothetical protein
VLHPAGARRPLPPPRQELSNILIAREREFLAERLEHERELTEVLVQRERAVEAAKARLGTESGLGTGRGDSAGA